MGCGGSKAVPAESAPSQKPTDEGAAPASENNAEPKADKKAAKATKTEKPKPVKKAEAFEVSVDDGQRTNSGKAPLRLQEHAEKKKKKPELTAEELEAKLKAAEERRQAQQVDHINKLKEHTEHVHEVKAGAAEGVDVKRKGSVKGHEDDEHRKSEIRKQVQEKSKARHQAALEDASKLPAEES